jgi:uncharacterized RDD family membrane protein YckC
VVRGRTGSWTVAARLVFALVALLFPLAGYSSAAPESKPRVTVKAAGDDGGAWLIRTSWRGYATESLGLGSEGLLNIFAWQRLGGARLEPVGLPPEIGRIVRWAASGPYLYVFYDDGTYRSYSPEARRIEIDLPRHVVPIAVTGMVSEPTQPHVGLYAIVPYEVGREIQRRAKEAATQPTTPGTPRTAPASAPGSADTRSAPLLACSKATDSSAVRREQPPQIGPAETEAEATFALVAYENGRWRYVGPVEMLPEHIKPDGLWLCASGSPQAVYAFWPAAGAADDASISVLNCSRWQDGRWTALPKISLGGPLGYGAAMYLDSRVAFAAGLRATAGSGRQSTRPAEEPAAAGKSQPTSSPAATPAATWRAWSWAVDRWHPGEPFTFDPETAASLSATPGLTALAPLGGNIFVAAVARAGEIEVGVWPPEGGPPKRRLEVTKVFELPRKPLIDPRMRDWLGLIIVLSVLALVFWRRQESLTVPASLPKGLVLAAYWKRLVAGVLDLLPAAVATAWLWYAPAMEYWQALAAASAGWKDTMPTAPDSLLLGWLLVRVLYAAYCGIFEWMWGATPGKRLLGCRVLSEGGQPPGLRDVLIRNFMRVPELEPYLPLWPLLLIMFFTRNRQRLGDLLARTVVVEPGQAVSRADSDDDAF